MTPEEYGSFDAIGLAAAIQAGEVSREDVLDAARARLAERNAAVNAVVAPIEPGGGDGGDGPLAGVPYLIKDLNTHVAGVATTHGSQLWRDAVPAESSVTVTRLQQAGLVLLGKTNTPELGVNASTEPVLFGPTRNPWSLSRTAGGSSGGAAAAVAAGIVPAAHATDGGGSIRIPASCCGLFGLKPTRGRLSMAPHASEGWAGMSVAHAVTRTVRDSAALLDGAAGPAPGDPYWAPPPARPFSAEVGADPGRLRVALLVSPPSATDVDPECVAAALAGASLCESLGHVVEPLEGWPFDPAVLAGAAMTIIPTSTASKVDERLAELGRTPASLTDDDIEPWTRMLVDVGRAVTAEAYVRAVEGIRSVGRSMAALHETWDVVLTPTLATLPARIGELGPDADPAAKGALLGRCTAFLSLANATGQPAMSVPLHRAADGMPVGVQFVAPFGAEALLLRLAAQLEAAAPWPQAAPFPFAP